MRKHAKQGLLLGREEGQQARHEIERAIAEQAPGTPIALDFDGIKSVSVPFADALLVPLLSNRLTGYYEDHPFLVINASEDVAETLRATLERRRLFILSLPRPTQLLGAERTLEETMRAADKLSPFNINQLAEALGLSQQATNNRVKELLRSGAMSRRRIERPRGGKEFVYEVPKTEAAVRKGRAGKSSGTASQRPVRHIVAA
ncbi:MAG: winged helix-turn-helix transcriptional regulator [Polyangiaceae bacterium]|nr:winged helix-turn-helix transcriptional regulator [Polyangiaceae bacterium]